MRWTVADIRTLLRRLEGEPADAFESETLECKSWDLDPRKLNGQLRLLRETVVCLVNARGGTVVLGINDRVRTRREALGGVGDLDPTLLRRAIYDGTEPPVLVEIEELIEPEARLLLIHVPRGLPPHTTTDGVGRIRVGKECKPLTGGMLAQLAVATGGRDLTAEILEEARLDDLDPDQVRSFQRLVATEGGKPKLGNIAAQELLENLGLVRAGKVTLAAVLVLGRPAALARWAQSHKVIFLRYRTATRYDVRRDLRGPILGVLGALQDLIEAHAQLSLFEAGGFGELTTPELTWWSAREAILNGLIHRDYFQHQSVYVELRPGRFDVVSPGGFVGGVEPSNILRHAPVRRNPLLADALQAAGFVNRAGIGIDRIYEELLRLGKGLPRFEADVGHVRATLPTVTQESFARLVAQQEREGRRLELDELILLRCVADHGRIDRWNAAQYLQTSEEEAARQLVTLRERGFLVPRGRGRGTVYQLTPAYSDLLRGRLGTDDSLPLDEDALKLRIQAILRERGRMTNEDVRRLSGYSRGEVLRLMRSLREQGIVRLEGRGRGAGYVPGPALVGASDSRSKRRGSRRRS